MIEDRAVETIGRTGEAARRETIGPAWTRIAAGVGMPEDDTGASAACRVRNDCSNGQGRVRPVPFVMGQVNAVQPVVDMGHEQALSSGIGLSEAPCEEVAGCRETIELERRFGTLIAHASQLCSGASIGDSNRVRDRLNFIHNGCVSEACADATAD